MKKICRCSCHKEGVEIIHIRPCCNLTGEKYFDYDGNLLLDTYNQLLNKAKIEYLEEMLINIPVELFGWATMKENNPKVYEAIIKSLKKAYNLGIDSANVAAEVIYDPNEYLGNTGSEYPATPVINRHVILNEKIT